MLDYVTPNSKLFLKVSRTKFHAVIAHEVLEDNRIVITHRGYTRPVAQFMLAVACDECNGEGVLYIDTTRRWDEQPSVSTCTCPHCKGLELVMLDDEPDPTPLVVIGGRRVGYANQGFVGGHLGW